MKLVLDFDIIVVIFILMGEGVIVIVCLSGEEVIMIVDCIFKSVLNKWLIDVVFYIIYYGYIVDFKIE